MVKKKNLSKTFAGWTSQRATKWSGLIYDHNDTEAPQASREIMPDRIALIDIYLHAITILNWKRTKNLYI